MIDSFGPYEPIVQAGAYYYTAGQVGIDLDTKQASDDVRAQTEQALANLKHVLAIKDLTFNDVTKTTVFITDMDDAPVVNEVYMAHFQTPRPARSMVAVKELPRVANVPLKVEVEAIAHKESSA